MWRGMSAELALRIVAGQRHFMKAHVVIVLASRFRRTFWKYRNHAKAYRAVILDAGHLSQMLYLAATERGLAAFITAAVNECDIEQIFGLDPMLEGCSPCAASVGVVNSLTRSSLIRSAVSGPDPLECAARLLGWADVDAGEVVRGIDIKARCSAAML